MQWLGNPKLEQETIKAHTHEKRQPINAGQQHCTRCKEAIPESESELYMQLAKIPHTDHTTPILTIASLCNILSQHLCLHHNSSLSYMSSTSLSCAATSQHHYYSFCDARYLLAHGTRGKAAIPRNVEWHSHSQPINRSEQ